MSDYYYGGAEFAWLAGHLIETLPGLSFAYVAMRGVRLFERRQRSAELRDAARKERLLSERLATLDAAVSTAEARQQRLVETERFMEALLAERAGPR